MIIGLELLTNTLFYVLLLTFSAICVLFIINIKNIIPHFRGITKHIWIILILILILGSYLRFNSPGCSAPAGLCWSYVEDARTALEEQKIYGYSHPKGYSFIIALGFLFFGLSFQTLLYLNLAMGSVLILLVFLLTYVLFKKEEIAIIAALIYSLFPASIFFANINASEISSVFFVTITFLIFIISLKEDKKYLYLLSMLLLVFSIHVRLENSMFIPVFFLLFFIERKNISFQKLKLPLILFFIFMLPLSFYYTNGYEIFGPGDPEVRKDYPDMFSLSYFIPTFQRQLFYLQKTDYPLILYPFLLLPLIFIKRERNLVFPFLWVATFFIFYCLQWGSLFTGLDLYQVLLHPPFAILMGYGIYIPKYFFEEKIIAFGTPYMLKFLNTLIVIFLIILLFNSTTDVFAAEKERSGVCVVEYLLNITSELEGDECILFENSEGWYNTPRPIRVMEVIFPDNDLAISVDQCENQEEMYYIHVNSTLCRPSFFGDGKPLYQYLKFNNFRINEVRRDMCVILYKIES